MLVFLSDRYLPDVHRDLFAYEPYAETLPVQLNH